MNFQDVKLSNVLLGIEKNPLGQIFFVPVENWDNTIPIKLFTYSSSTDMEIRRSTNFI